MKKAIALVLALACILFWLIWGQGETYTVHVTVPACNRRSPAAAGAAVNGRSAGTAAGL